MTTLSVTQVAALYDVDPSTVRWWCQTGALPADQLGGFMWSISPESLETFERPKPGRPPKAREGEEAECQD